MADEGMATAALCGSGWLEAMTVLQTRRYGFRWFVSQLPAGLGFVLAIGGMIAALAPFDVVFADYGDSALNYNIL